MVNMKLVTTKTGKIEGIEAEGYTIFKGIPYAKPPVGSVAMESTSADRTMGWGVSCR